MSCSYENLTHELVTLNCDSVNEWREPILFSPKFKMYDNKESLCVHNKHAGREIKQ